MEFVRKTHMYVCVCVRARVRWGMYR